MENPTKEATLAMREDLVAQIARLKAAADAARPGLNATLEEAAARVNSARVEHENAKAAFFAARAHLDESIRAARTAALE